MKMRFMLATVFLIASAVYANTAIPVKVIEVESIKPADTFYTGKVDAIEKGKFSFDLEGKVSYIKNAGDYVFQEIYDSETKKVIRNGTIVAKYDRTRQRFALKEAETSLKIAEAEFNKANWNFERYEKLKTRRAISGKEFLDMQTEYMNAKLKLTKAQNDLAKAKYDMDACKIIAPFSGIVSKVFVSQDTHISKGDDVVELTKMTPILVRIPFPEEIVSHFQEGTNVTIYPVNGGEPVDAWCRTGLSGNMLYAYIENAVIGLGADNKEIKFKKIYEIFPVNKISTSSAILNELSNIDIDLEQKEYPLAVPEESIKKDEKGYYVLRIKKLADYHKLSKFKLEKVSIVPGGIKREFNLGSNRDVTVCSLKDKGSLEENDRVMLLGEKGLKDGDEVVLANLRWKFAPGQLVKVNIPSLHEPGIYVPANAVIHQADSDNYVYIVENNKAKLVSVNITGRCSGNNKIEGDGIVSGVKVVVFEDTELSKKLYDSAPVEIAEEIATLERIKYRRADGPIMGINEIEKTYFMQNMSQNK